MGKHRFQIVYDPKVYDHLATIERRYYPLIRSTIEEQLAYHPDLETHNRKPLRRLSTLGEAGEVWELRFGPDNRFRVFYKFGLEASQVFILAIGVKKGNQLIIGEEVFQL
jgi:mRNA-degrading endonuclease RelE of RelBE toxin-antitoxin system